MYIKIEELINTAVSKSPHVSLGWNGGMFFSGKASSSRISIICASTTLHRYFHN